MAKQFGATTLVERRSDGDPVSKVMELTEQRGVDVAFEVIGLKQTIEQTLTMTRRGGEAILVGVPRMEVMLELPAFFGVVLMSKTIKGCWYGSSNVQKDVPRLLELLQERRAQARRADLTTHPSRRRQRGVHGDGSRRGRPLRHRILITGISPARAAGPGRERASVPAATSLCRKEAHAQLPRGERPEWLRWSSRRRGRNLAGWPHNG